MSSYQNHVGFFVKAVTAKSLRLSICQYQWHEESMGWNIQIHDDVIKWKHFPRHWSFVRGIHRWRVNSPRKGQWRGALIFSLICVSINGWVNNREAGDLRRHRAHYDAIVMCFILIYRISKFHLSANGYRQPNGVGGGGYSVMFSFKPKCSWCPPFNMAH